MLVEKPKVESEKTALTAWNIQLYKKIKTLISKIAYEGFPILYLPAHSYDVSKLLQEVTTLATNGKS